jgi:hypothetical protein
MLRALNSSLKAEENRRALACIGNSSIRCSGTVTSMIGWHRHKQSCTLTFACMYTARKRAGSGLSATEAAALQQQLQHSASQLDAERQAGRTLRQELLTAQRDAAAVRTAAAEEKALLERRLQEAHARSAHATASVTSSNSSPASQENGSGSGSSKQEAAAVAAALAAAEGRLKTVTEQLLRKQKLADELTCERYTPANTMLVTAA